MTGIRDRLARFASSEDALARVFRNSAWMFSAKGFGAIASLVYLAIVTRTLGPEGFGSFILIVSSVQIVAAVIRLQTWQTTVHFGGPLIARGDRAGFSRIVFGDFGVELAGAIAAIGALWLLADPLAVRLGWTIDMERGVAIYSLLSFLGLRSTSTGVLRASDRFRDVALGDGAIPLIRLAGALTVLAIGPTVTGFLIVWGLSEMGSALVQGWLVFSRKLVGRPGKRVPQPGYWHFLFATNASYILTVVRERGGVMVVGLFVGEAAAGLFRLADQLAGSINRITEIFSRPLFTEMSRLYAHGARDRSQDLFYRSLRISAITGAAMLLAIFVLGRPLIWLMSGEEFLPAYPMLLILGASTIIGLASLGVEPLLQAAGRPGLALTARLVWLAAVAALLVAWTGTYGVIGASWAILVSTVLTAALMLWFAQREINRSASLPSVGAP